MAIGLGPDVRLPASSRTSTTPTSRARIPEFWRRWHISLSTWFRDYLYIPLGGNRTGPAGPTSTWSSVFLLVRPLARRQLDLRGLGALPRRLPGDRARGPLPRDGEAPRRSGPHLHVSGVMVGWVLFRAETFSQAMAFFAALVGAGAGAGLVHNAARYFTVDVQLAMLLGIVFSAPVVCALGHRLGSVLAPAGWLPAPGGLRGGCSRRRRRWASWCCFSCARSGSQPELTIR